MLNTELLGEPAACRETGEWMLQVSAGTFDTATLLGRLRDRTHECWRGEAASAFEDHLSRGGRESDQLSQELARAGRALVAFSEELGTVAARLQQAREVAAAAGLTVTSEGIEPPPTVILPAEPSTPQQLAAVAAYQAQTRAWDEAFQTVSYARGLERAAHERLERDTRPLSDALARLRQGAGFIALGAVLGAAASLHTQNARYRELSGQRARESLELTRRLAEDPDLTRAQRAELKAARDALVERAVRDHRVAMSHTRLLAGLDGTSGGRFLLDGIALAPGRDMQAANLFARTAKVLGKVPYVGWLVTGVQVGEDIRHGKPADRAIIPALTATAAGSGAGSGLLAASAALGIAGGPVTLAAVAAGVVVTWGVGYAMDSNWDGIRDAGGDAAAAVGDGARSVAGKVGRWLGE